MDLNGRWRTVITRCTKMLRNLLTTHRAASTYCAHIENIVPSPNAVKVLEQTIPGLAHSFIPSQLSFYYTVCIGAIVAMELVFTGKAQTHSLLLPQLIITHVESYSYLGCALYACVCVYILMCWNDNVNEPQACVSKLFIKCFVLKGTHSSLPPYPITSVSR